MMRQAINQRANQSSAGCSISRFFRKASVRFKPFPWVLSAAAMTLSPLASFQQVDHDKKMPHNTLVIQRPKVTPKTHLQQSSFSYKMAGKSDVNTQKVISQSSAMQIEQADHVINQQFLLAQITDKEIILPSLGLLQYMAADEEMELLFHLSNASWVENILQIDYEMDRSFWQSNYPNKSKNTETL